MTPHWPSVDRASRQVEAMQVVLKRLTRQTLAELRRRAGESPRPLEEGPGPAVSDGYPSGSQGESDVHSGRRSDPTIAAALRGYVVDAKTGKVLGWQSPYDPVGDSLREFFALLAEANGVLRQLDRRLAYLLTDRDSAERRGPAPPPPGAGICEACEAVATGVVGDKLVSGYCPRCRKRWERAGYPDRVVFARQVRVERDSPPVSAENGQVSGGA